ncbi:hypothetical protein APHAL10511_008493 [Amanita phalloides]|nr:hypothetical protein APHAL10511_008493 [Amanita phalloides]
MSLVQLTLRPPPHVDFVTGYPGIPPNGSDRPQAAVKGAIEVRVPAQGVKAQWVKVELRKVETLPGGGAANTFYDVVGPGSLTLWASEGAEYELLHAQDFPFSIRIPEAVPPSLQLEARAGVHYELVATVCTKGKRGFFRKRKQAVAMTSASVIIDKHDLHSTWPVYCQPENRHVIEDGIKLTVERNQSCYGPADRISVTATIRSDSPQVIMLRAFEILLKETITYRGHIYVAGKKGEPLTRTNIIADNKFQVNTPMQGGMQTTQDLYCMLSPSHTNTTLTAARHIDITYVLIVKALAGNGLPLVIELPVIVSNWQRHDFRGNPVFDTNTIIGPRIGPSPGLSVLQMPGPGGANPSAQQSITRVEPIQNRAPQMAAALPLNHSTTPDGYGSRQPSNGPYNTLPMTSSTDAYGASSRRPAHQTAGSQGSAQSGRPADEFGAWPKAAGSKPGVGTGKRPTSAGSTTTQTQRFTITNALPLEIPEESQSSLHQRNDSAQLKGPWLSAAEEKQKLYEQAKARVEMVQGGVVVQSSSSPSPPLTQAPPPQAKPPARSNPWPTAEEEKLKLFQSAQAAVARTQGYGAVPVASDPTLPPSTSKAPSAAAVMYSQAIAARNDASKQHSPPAPAKIHLPMATSSKVPKVPGYLTAEEEKAALRRYEEAKIAVDRVQGSAHYSDTPGGSGSGPISYDSLYPSASSGSGLQTTTTPPAQNDLPPPFEAGLPLTAPQQLSEKERLRRAYEAQDAAALSRQNSVTVAAPTQGSTAQSPMPKQASTYDASPPSFSGNSAYPSPSAEKELLRRRFEAQDMLANGMSPAPPQPPPRNASTVSQSTPVRSTSVLSNNSSFRSRPAPLPPVVDSNGQRVLTAAEEKALLKAKYDAQDSPVGEGLPPMYLNGYVNGLPSAGSSTGASSIVSPLSYASSVHRFGSPPPPLMPRPPQEYIKETQEEDARVARMAMNGGGAMPPIESGAQNGFSKGEIGPSVSRKPAATNHPTDWPTANRPPLPRKPLGD